MTYRRAPGSWAEAMTESLRAGQDWLAAQLGVSPSRLRQCANPMRRDSLPVALACEADILCARAGLGTPLFDAYRRRLDEAGALATAESLERRTSVLRAACQAAAMLLLAALRAENPRGDAFAGAAA